MATRVGRLLLVIWAASLAGCGPGRHGLVPVVARGPRAAATDGGVVLDGGAASSLGQALDAEDDPSDD